METRALKSELNSLRRDFLAEVERRRKDNTSRSPPTLSTVEIRGPQPPVTEPWKEEIMEMRKETDKMRQDHNLSEKQQQKEIDSLQKELEKYGTVHSSVRTQCGELENNLATVQKELRGLKESRTGKQESSTSGTQQPHGQLPTESGRSVDLSLRQELGLLKEELTLLRANLLMNYRALELKIKEKPESQILQQELDVLKKELSQLRTSQVQNCGAMDRKIREMINSVETKLGRLGGEIQGCKSSHGQGLVDPELVRQIARGELDQTKERLTLHEARIGKLEKLSEQACKQLVHFIGQTCKNFGRICEGVGMKWVERGTNRSVHQISEASSPQQTITPRESEESQEGVSPTDVA